MKEEKEKLAKEKYVELQILDAQMNQLQQQIQAFETQSVEIDSVMQSLAEIKNSKVGSEILVPISSGIFLKAELRENDKLAVNVGGNTVVYKSTEETKELLGNQVLELRKANQELIVQLEKMAANAEKLQIEISKLVSE